ncbi:MAG: hypothetical protein MJ025_00910 [Victivallaceae bacterium]|nr:hypothetical protein [Victivallaceae bacterium]
MGRQYWKSKATELCLELDRRGFIPIDGETAAEFVARVTMIENCRDQFLETLERDGSGEYLKMKVLASERIPETVRLEADSITERLYDFTFSGGLGFFSDSVGFLGGGLTVGMQGKAPLFLLRKCFAARRKWSLYYRDELLSHELCHAARQALDDPSLEEVFAYGTSPSRFRRLFGGCFVGYWDPIVFLMLALLPLAVSFLAPGFTPHATAPLGGWTLFLVVRNLWSRHVVTRAANRLADFGFEKPMAMLFRMRRDEIVHVGELRDKGEFERYVNLKSAKSLRWNIIRAHFGRTTHRTIP